jgi:hypothetical protein
VPDSPLPALCAAAAGVPVLAEEAGDRVAPARAVLALAEDRLALASPVAAARSDLDARHGPESLERWREFLATG